MFEVIQMPSIATPANITAGTAILRTASQDAAEVMQAELSRLTRPYGHIAESWEVQHRPARGPLAWAVISDHPGAAPLNFGAHWPSKMPPWGPNSPLGKWAAAHGIPAFLVARKLQREGLLPRRFMQTARDNKRDEVKAIIDRKGMKVWVGRLGRHRG
jgi:hypothetical protein